MALALSCGPVGWRLPWEVCQNIHRFNPEHSAATHELWLRRQADSQGARFAFDCVKAQVELYAGLYATLICRQGSRGDALYRAAFGLKNEYDDGHSPPAALAFRGELALLRNLLSDGAQFDEETCASAAMVRRCKLDPNLKAPGFKGST